MSVLNINGVELDFNLYDADVVERYEEANDKVIEMDTPESTKGKRMSEIIKYRCMIVEEFFDHVFGEGTSEKLFGGKKDLQIHVDAFKTACDYVVQFSNSMIMKSQKYSSDRAQRRPQLQGHKKKNKKYIPPVIKQPHAGSGDDKGNEA